MRAVRIDFLGLIYIKVADQDIKGSIVLIRCMTTRVTHLEVVEGQSANHAVEAWTRFTLKNGVVPRYMLSDGARAFKNAKTMITHVVADNEPLKSEQVPFKWEIAHLNAPHRRSFIKILVKSVKKAIQAILPRIKVWIGRPGKQWLVR